MNSVSNAEMSDPNNWNKDKLQNAINTLEAKVNALEVKIDKIMSHFGVK